MVVLMAIAFTLAQPCFPRNKINLPKPLKKLIGFNAFWYSHHLFVIVYVFFIIHGQFLYTSARSGTRKRCVPIAMACQPANDDKNGLLRADMFQGNNKIPRMPRLVIDEVVENDKE
ncbi:unnamed protein product [Lupinus luteus]|uniref:Uncharacterized protein n=1 Tax=Lupinus luteus TaxID=3873 RepID=A0AAV1VSV8_LUPLU